MDEVTALLEEVSTEADSQNSSILKEALHELSTVTEIDRNRIRKELRDELPATCQAMVTFRRWKRAKERLAIITQPNYGVSRAGRFRNCQKRCGCTECHGGPIKIWAHTNQVLDAIIKHEAEMKTLSPCRQCLMCMIEVEKQPQKFLLLLNERLSRESESTRQELTKILLDLALEE